MVAFFIIATLATLAIIATLATLAKPASVDYEAWSEDNDHEMDSLDKSIDPALLKTSAKIGAILFNPAIHLDQPLDGVDNTPLSDRQTELTVPKIVIGTPDNRETILNLRETINLTDVQWSTEHEARLDALWELRDEAGRFRKPTLDEQSERARLGRAKAEWSVAAGRQKVR